MGAQGSLTDKIVHQVSQEIRNTQQKGRPNGKRERTNIRSGPVGERGRGQDSSANGWMQGIRTTV